MRCNILTLLDHFIKSFVSLNDFQTVFGGIELFYVVHKYCNIKSVQDFFDQVRHQTTNTSIGNK